MSIIGRLGGYLGRPCDGPAGYQTLWQGYMLFNVMTDYQRMLDGEQT